MASKVEVRCAEEGRNARVRVQGLVSVDREATRFPTFEIIKSPYPGLRATTATCGRRSVAIMWGTSILLAAALAVPSQALHFFMDGAVQKCFYEELPKDTLVVGTTPSHDTNNTRENREYHGNMIANHTRSLPRRSLGRRDQNLHEQGRHRRFRHRRGDVRQQPPHRRPTRVITGSLYLQRRRLRPTPHLRHSPKCS